jgi:hypothetical protein
MYREVGNEICLPLVFMGFISIGQTSHKKTPTFLWRLNSKLAF